MQIDRLVRLIYDSVGDADGWRRFLTEFADAVAGTTTMLFAQDLRNDVGRVSVSIRWDPEWEHRHDEYYSRCNPWILSSKHLVQPGAVLSGPMLCPDSEVKRTEYYHDFLRPQALLHQFGASLTAERDWVAIITTVRPESAGPFDQAELSVLETLVPHLRRALELQRQLQAAQFIADAADVVWDRLAVGVVLVDGSGGPLFINAVARRILDRCDGLRLLGGRLAASARTEDAALQRLLWEAARTTAGQGSSAGGTLAISRASGERPYRIAVAPLPSRRYFVFGNSPDVIVIIDDPAETPVPDAASVAQLYGLTPAEGRLVAALATGCSLREAAERLGIQYETARSRIKSVFSKTGTRRQADLMRLVSTFRVR